MIQPLYQRSEPTMDANGYDPEKANALHHNHLHDRISSDDNGAPLKPTTTNITLSSEQFERLYLQPQTQVKGDLRKTFANPTPLALLGFSVGLTPLAAELLGWRGAGGGTGNPQATVGATIWFGGVLLLIAGMLEWVLGNTFPFIVFMGYGCHFLTVATTLTPFFSALSAYTDGNPYGDGSQVPTMAFESGFGEFCPFSHSYRLVVEKKGKRGFG